MCITVYKLTSTPIGMSIACLDNIIYIYSTINDVCFSNTVLGMVSIMVLVLPTAKIMFLIRNASRKFKQFVYLTKLSARFLGLEGIGRVHSLAALTVMERYIVKRSPALVLTTATCLLCNFDQSCRKFMSACHVSAARWLCLGDQRSRALPPTNRSLTSTEPNRQSSWWATKWIFVTQESPIMYIGRGTRSARIDAHTWPGRLPRSKCRGKTHLVSLFVPPDILSLVIRGALISKWWVIICLYICVVLFSGCLNHMADISGRNESCPLLYNKTPLPY